MPLISGLDRFEHRHLGRRCCRRCCRCDRRKWTLYLILPSGGPFFKLIWGWDNAPVQSASAIPLIADPPFSPNLDPADFFLFPKAKGQLAGLSFAQEARGKKTRGAELSPPRSAAGLSSAKSAFESAVSKYKKAKN